MNTDISRDIHDAGKHYSRVVMQQGRVLVDSDWNAAAAIQLHQIRQTARDLIGPHGGPAGGFAITVSQGKLMIGPGHYYVDGILCENDAAGPVPFSSQPDRPTGLGTPGSGIHLVYLDVWERELTCHDDPLLREVALGGPDTTTRTKVTWQVRLLAVPQRPATPDATVKGLRADPVPRLRAEAKRDDPAQGPCSLSPDARFRRHENQLYRVEIHRRGEVGAAVAEARPTVKWSRDNAARAVFPITGGAAGGYTVADLGRDDRTTLRKGDWVELTDEDHAVDGLGSRPLWKVEAVDEDDLVVRLSGGVDLHGLIRPALRRWDQSTPEQVGKDGTIPVRPDEPIELEDGVRVTFERGGQCRPGDHWLIPARVATGNVEWPLDHTGWPPVPALRPPAGVTHHYAPLAWFEPTANPPVSDLRRVFKNLYDLSTAP